MPIRGPARKVRRKKKGHTAWQSPQDAATAAMRKGKALAPRALSVSRCAPIDHAGPVPPVCESNRRMEPAENPQRKAEA